MFNGFKATAILVFWTSTTLLHAAIDNHTFELEKGMVIYDIYGGGVLTQETNLSLNGKAVLRFKDWGTTLLSGDEGTVSTTGALESKQSIASLEKQTKEALYTVDFKNEKIHERKNSISNTLKELDTNGLKKTGEDNVAGFTCDVWEGRGVRKCLYKGLPLKVESEILGITYNKVARDVVFDLNSSEVECTLPAFPKESFGLLNSTLKTKNETKAKCFTDVLRDVAHIVEKKVAKNGNYLGIGKKEKISFLNKIGQKIYKHQKEMLPLLLISMKETRECLSTGANIFEANQCMESFTHLKEQLGTEENEYIVLWNDKKKNELLDKIEDQIIYLESRMPCIKRTQNITDLSSCMK